MKACSNHYFHNLWYEYDSNRKLILVRERLSLNNNTNDCLCQNHRERTILNEPFSVPKIIHPSAAYQVNSDNFGVSVIETVQSTYKK